MTEGRLAPIERLVKALRVLPGVGEKTATRFAYFLLAAPEEASSELGDAIQRLRQDVVLCEGCFNLTARSPCAICSDDSRSTAQLCVVEEPRDIVAVEKTREFTGRYHVLQGAISPIDGVGPDSLRVKELLARVDTEDIAEVILCTNPNIEGEATAMYLSNVLADRDVRVTRIASGLPVGGDLEYADELTLGRALEGRRRVEGV